MTESYIHSYIHRPFIRGMWFVDCYIHTTSPWSTDTLLSILVPRVSMVERFHMLNHCITLLLCMLFYQVVIWKLCWLHTHTCLSTYAVHQNNFFKPRYCLMMHRKYCLSEDTHSSAIVCHCFVCITIRRLVRLDYIYIFQGAQPLDPLDVWPVWPVFKELSHWTH